MRITRDEVSNQFDALIAGHRSREEIEGWAQARMEAQDRGELIYEPSSDEDQLWCAIKYLLGVGLKTSRSSYLHSVEDVEAFRLEVNVRAVIWRTLANSSPEADRKEKVMLRSRGPRQT